MNGIEPARLSWAEADAVVRALAARGRGVAWEQFCAAAPARAANLAPILPIT